MKIKTTAKAFTLLLICALACSCGDEDDPMAPSIVLSGTVTNNSGVSGTIIVEIDRSVRDVADVLGHFILRVNPDFLVDSLYAWVDENSNSFFDAGEPYGEYPTSFHVGSSNIGNLNFSIP